jgi:hypothetical protein
MKKIFLFVGIFFAQQILFTSWAQAQTTKAKSKKVSSQKPVTPAKPAAPAKTLPAPPSAQAAAAAMPATKPEPVVILPPMGDYKYEINFAPLALFANWYAIDFLKYDPSAVGDSQRQQFGYGITGISFIRNNNDFDDTFPSRSGYAVGLTGVWDFRDYYYSTHGYYEKFERYQDKGTLVQEREGFRVTAVIGLKEVIKRRYALKFGAGFEVETYKVREFHETNRFVQTNYQTNILNPFFLECKLAMYF